MTKQWNRRELLRGVGCLAQERNTEDKRRLTIVWARLRRLW